ncbi:MAG: sulfatase [Elusimicrobiota bacterium]
MFTLSLALLLLTYRVGPAHAADRPLNVIVVDICSARTDRMGSYGSKAGLTPGLDAFAKEAATFENAWAQSSWCLPNYATLMTGHRPEVHGLVANLPFRGLPDWETTVAERMRNAGYRTGAFTAGSYTLPAWGLDRGFDHYINRFDAANAHAGRFSELVPEIDKWISAKSTQPFFLYTTVDDLHSPYQGDASTETYEGVSLDTTTLGVRFFRAYNGTLPAPDSPLRAKLEEFRRDPRSLPAVAWHYEQALRATDRSVARFLEGLKKRGVWDDTVIIVTADHGELLGEHGLLGHTEGLYQPILHVPMFIRDPSRPNSAGSRVPALVERIDLAPTFLDIANAQDPWLELQGRSLRPLLSNPRAPWRRYSYASSKRNLDVAADYTIDERAIRDERWKLIWSLPQGNWHLYDLKNDPMETTNLASKHPEQLARLAFALQTEAEAARPHGAGRPSGRLDKDTRLRPEDHD